MKATATVLAITLLVSLFIGSEVWDRSHSLENAEYAGEHLSKPLDTAETDTVNDPGLGDPSLEGTFLPTLKSNGTPPAVGVGLAPVADWSTQQPFIDIMKTARPWLGHLPGQFGGMGYEDLQARNVLDPQGWPVRIPPELSSIGTLLLTDMPEAAVSLAGRYLLRFDGEGIVEVSGRAENKRYGKGEVSFSYAPGPGSVDIRIQRSSNADPVRNITVVKEENQSRLDAGERFNPAWLARIGGFSGLRFMDWMAVNDSTLSDWHERPRPTDVTYAWQGVPIEVQVELANELQIDPWFNIPHLATDSFVRSFAEYVKSNLDPSLTAYVEFSNEVWNWQFAQAHWADEQAIARWGQKDAWVQYYALRAREVAQIWKDVFARDSEARLVSVISTQTGWIGLEEMILTPPLLQAETAGAVAPAEVFDAYAVSGYFGGVLGVADYEPLVQAWLQASENKAQTQAEAQGLSGAEAESYVSRHRYDHANALAAQDVRDGSLSDTGDGALTNLISKVWPHHANAARRHNLKLVVYEGGSHIVGIGPQLENDEITHFIQHFSYTPEIASIYQTLITAWHDLGGELFMAYNDVYAPTKWGSWGGLRHLDDDNPRWQVLTSSGR